MRPGISLSQDDLLADRLRSGAHAGEVDSSYNLSSILVASIPRRCLLASIDPVTDERLHLATGDIIDREFNEPGAFHAKAHSDDRLGRVRSRRPRLL